MINKDDFKIELPHYVKQDIIIDLLVQNLAYMKSLGKFIVEEYSQKNNISHEELVEELNDQTKQIKYDILAFMASKYGK